MYKIPKPVRTTIHANTSVEGEMIETRIERLLNNSDEVTEGKELLYTRPEEGVIAAFNIRHDHWDDAYEQSSIMAEKRHEMDEAKLQKRTELLKQKAEEEKFLKDQAKKGMAEGKTGEQSTGGEV